MALTFKYTILYVDDVPATVAFFGRAFGFGTKMLHESGDFAELETSDHPGSEVIRGSRGDRARRAARPFA